MQAIPYGRQSINDEDIEAVVATLKSAYLTQGPAVKQFEDEFAKYTDAKYAVAVSNGTAALHLCALALDVQPGDKWLTTPITFAASANCIKYCGGEIEFVDINPETFCLDLDKVEQKLKASPIGTFKGIIPVDFAGYPVDLEKLSAIAKRYDLKIIEDACHAPGGSFTDSNKNEQKCGNGQFADLSIFSFHPVKHIATGEGGMVTTNSKELYDKLCLLRTHGITKNEDLLSEKHGGWYYEMVELGYNYRLSDLQAALGVTQLKRAEEGIAKRHKIADNYTKAFSEIEQITTPSVSENVNHAYHLYVIQVEDRKGLYEFLRKHQIFSQVHYIPVHTLPYYQKQGWKKGDMPCAESYYEKCLSLPMFPALTQDEQQFVIETVIEFVNK